MQPENGSYLLHSSWGTYEAGRKIPNIRANFVFFQILLVALVVLLFQNTKYFITTANTAFLELLDQVTKS